MEKKIRVLVCDDSAVIRKILSSFINEAEDMELVGVAVDPFDAREKIKALNPDVLTLDIEMPRMDGLSFLEKIMTLRPMPVIMVSTLTQRGAAATLQALETGAFDYIGKPEGGLIGDVAQKFCDSLLDKIRAASDSRIVDRYRSRSQQSATGALLYHPPVHNPIELIALGSSTGGVEALRDVFSQLPAGLPPIVIVQHMPGTFTESFSKRLDGVSAVQVQQVKHNEELLPGHAYVGEGGKHFMIVRRGTKLVAHVAAGHTVSGHCPSVDVLFESVAKHVAANAVGTILTGMGKDGASGLLSMRRAGAMTFGQDEASCVVYGMPKAAFTMGAVVKQVPLNQVARQVVAQCEKGATQHVG